MTIVRNYSELSPAMRDALLHAHPVEQYPALKGKATAAALARRGLAIDLGNGWFRLTEAGRRARDHIQADVPAKVAAYLDRARQLGLEVHRSEDSGTLKSWTISSPNPIDTTQLWLYWGPGARGGRVSFSIYYGPSSRIRRNYPLRFIYYTMQEMGDSLQRHHEREAARLAQAQAALAHVFTELDGAEIPGDQEAPAGGVPWQEPEANPVADVARFKQQAEDLGDRVPECGCPDRIVADEGHQEGCVHHRIDPTRPGWFLVGQHLYDHRADVHAQIVGIGVNGNSRANAVAVTIQGGYGGGWIWYGEHPDSHGRTLDMLEGPHMGIVAADLRRWPKPRAALSRVKILLAEQCLSGWAATGEDDNGGQYVTVNVPRGVDPTRHRILLARYMPYRCTVAVRASRSGQVGDAIIIRPREES